MNMEILGFWTPSGFELVVIALIALLLFGKRLPEVARGLGKGVVEFKKGLKGVEEEVEDADYQQPKKHLPVQPAHDTQSHHQSRVDMRRQG